jgi:hypothetical protein
VNIVEENDGDSDDQMNDDDLLNMENANNNGLDQEQLTAEEKEENIIKSLNANNPNAPHNSTFFSYKERCFKRDDIVEHVVTHFCFEGDLLTKDSDEARDMEDYWDNKQRNNQIKMDIINKAIIQEFGKDPLEGNERAQKKSLRN